ncbi:unnamed protein product [Lampetra fluviatilis]
MLAPHRSTAARAVRAQPPWLETELAQRRAARGRDDARAADGRVRPRMRVGEYLACGDDASGHGTRPLRPLRSPARTHAQCAKAWAAVVRSTKRSIVA